MRNHGRRNLITASLVFLLAACGGGGGSGNSSTAEGFWTGTSSTGYTVRLAVLETGETWGFYTSGSTIYGALYGSTSSGAGSLSGSGSDFFFPTRQVVSASYSGTYTAKQALRVTTSSGTTFSGNYAAEYDTPASLSAVAGTFAGSGLSSSTSAISTTVVISTNGTLTATNGFCTGTGSVAPRASGKGIFNVTLTFTGASCALTGAGPVTGIAYYDSANRSLIALGLTGSKADGFFWAGAK